MTAREDAAARVERYLDAFAELPDSGDQIHGVGADGEMHDLRVSDLRVLLGASRPRVVTTAAELDAIPPGSLGYAGHGPRLLVRRLIWDHEWLLGHELAVQVTSEELIARAGDVTVVWSPPAETPDGAA